MPAFAGMTTERSCFQPNLDAYLPNPPPQAGEGADRIRGASVDVRLTTGARGTDHREVAKTGLPLASLISDAHSF